MHRSFRKRKKINPSLILSAFVLLTMPIAIYSLVSSQNFDMRNLAYDQAEEKKCTILIPYVNSKTLELDTEYNVLIYANLDEEKIKGAEVFDNEDNRIFSKNYDGVKKISETFNFAPSILGENNITGQIQTDSNQYSCQMFQGQNLVYVVEKNRAPTFLTAPFLYDETSYEYILEARDEDLDQIHYAYSFEPRANWINKTVLENGRSGNLQLQFTGIPETERTYNATVFLHDGHGKNVTEQKWAIDTEKGEVKELEKEYKILSEIGNNVYLPIPQIISMHPTENSYTTDFETKISANLIASKDASIEKKDIVFKINNSNLSKQIDAIEISSGEILIEYEPQIRLETGEHRAYIYFKDSEGFEKDKEWTFTVDSETDEGTFLGFPITSVAIFSIGVLLVLFAISIPWILYIAWKKDQTEEYEEIPIIKPEGDSSFKKSFEKKE